MADYVAGRGRRLKIFVAHENVERCDALSRIYPIAGDIEIGDQVQLREHTLSRIWQDEWDVLLLNLTLNSTDAGLGLVREIKHERPKLPLLLLGTHSERRYAVRAIRAGASGYVSFDSAAEVLALAIHLVANGGIYVCPEVGEQLARDCIANSEPDPHTLLPDREYQVCLMLIDGLEYAEIADALGVSVITVRSHTAHILKRLKLADRAGLKRYALEHQLSSVASRHHRT